MFYNKRRAVTLQHDLLAFVHKILRKSKNNQVKFRYHSIVHYMEISWCDEFVTVEVALRPLNRGGFLCLEMGIDTHESHLASLAPVQDKALFARHGLSRGSGTHSLHLVSHLDRAFGMKRSSLVDASARKFMGTEVSLRHLFLLSRGRTWYGQHGYVRKNDPGYESQVQSSRTASLDPIQVQEASDALSVSPKIITNLLVGDLSSLVETWCYAGRITGEQTNKVLRCLTKRVHFDAFTSGEYVKEYSDKQTTQTNSRIGRVPRDCA